MFEGIVKAFKGTPVPDSSSAAGPDGQFKIKPPVAMVSIGGSEVPLQDATAVEKSLNGLKTVKLANGNTVPADSPEGKATKLYIAKMAGPGGASPTDARAEVTNSTGFDPRTGVWAEGKGPAATTPPIDGPQHNG